jgi:hypothetical protein
MGLKENNEYRTYLAQLVKDWDREIWPTMRECGFTRDTAFMVYMLQRVEQSMYVEEEAPRERREPWQE